MKVKMLAGTRHNATGSVAEGDVVEVDDELAAHWIDQGLAEEVKPAKKDVHEDK